MYVCARSNPDVFRVPRKSKKFDELLQTATKKVLQHTVWGTEGRMLFEVDREYLVQMPRPEQRLWQARTRARTHSHTHTFTLTHSHTHTLTHSHTHTLTQQATKCAALCRSRKNDHISVSTLLEREPPFPDEPWRVDRITVQRDREIFMSGGYKDGPWPRSVYHPMYGWRFNGRSK